MNDRIWETIQKEKDMKIKKIGTAITLSVVAGMSIVSMTGCGASESRSEPVTDTKAQNVQKVEFDGQRGDSPVIIFDVMRPDGTVVTCSTKPDGTAGASCFARVR